MLFKFDNVGKEFSGKWLFRGLSVQGNPGDRIGLIGRNGTGKTTFLNLIDGSASPDEGQVGLFAQIKISRIDQIPTLDRD
ncbi:MAG: ATP-binding cassette domain-containing protein, partial [bacterium]